MLICFCLVVAAVANLPPVIHFCNHFLVLAFEFLVLVFTLLLIWFLFLVCLSHGHALVDAEQAQKERSACGARKKKAGGKAAGEAGSLVEGESGAECWPRLMSCY